MQKGTLPQAEVLGNISAAGYTLGRTHINSCDFSISSYSFDDHDGEVLNIHTTVRMILQVQFLLRILGQEVPDPKL